MKFLDVTGTLTHAPADPARPLAKYVYQHVKPGLGNVSSDKKKSLQLRAHVIPLDPKTPQQLARRTLMKAAVTAWHALPDSTKEAWRVKGQQRAISGFNAYCGAYLRTGSPPTP